VQSAVHHPVKLRRWPFSLSSATSVLCALQNAPRSQLPKMSLISPFSLSIQILGLRFSALHVIVPQTQISPLSLSVVFIAVPAFCLSASSLFHFCSSLCRRLDHAGVLNRFPNSRLLTTSHDEEESLRALNLRRCFCHVTHSAD
jgi:hypothetical protein